MQSDVHGGDRLTRAAAAGCAESRALLSRRSILGLSAGLFSSAFLPRWAEAGSASDPRLLVVMVRGGMDGLSTVVPIGDPNYARLRGAVAIPAASTLRLDSFFGLHPALKTFNAWYRAGDAAAVHATCVPVRNRSHFDAQDNLESGLAGVATNPTGWLNRLLTVLPAGDPVKTGGAIQIGEAPLILRGPAPVLGWSPTWFPDADRELRDKVLGIYRATDKVLEANLLRGLRADGLADAAGGGSDDGISQLRKAFRGAARLIRGNSGPRIAVLAVDGFDTHVDQGGVGGELADRLTELDTGLADFKREIGSIWSQTVVVCATEFGRTARINGDAGTDHGVATVALLAGGAVNGGRVFGKWPGLATVDLYENSDLKPTTDLRAVFKGVLQAHLDVPKSLLDGTIFPQSVGLTGMTSLIRAAAPSAGVPAAPAGLEQTANADPRMRSPLLTYRGSGTS